MPPDAGDPAPCLALAGKVEEAEERFSQLLTHGNDLGLFAEEIDPADGKQLGNFPQVFSHVGLVSAAWRLTEAARGCGEEASTPQP